MSSDGRGVVGGHRTDPKILTRLAHIDDRAAIIDHWDVVIAAMPSDVWIVPRDPRSGIVLSSVLKNNDLPAEPIHLLSGTTLVQVHERLGQRVGPGVADEIELAGIIFKNGCLDQSGRLVRPARLDRFDFIAGGTGFDNLAKVIFGRP